MHSSDCAVNNGPAYPAGKCDCGHSKRGGWKSVLEAAAYACAGEDGCVQCLGPEQPCCMTENARRVFEFIALAGGPTLEQCEAIAAGTLIMARPV